MALDGLFTYKLCAELRESLIASRVEKIYQPSKEELVFVMRSKQGAKKLYMSARADSARMHLTEKSFINPSNPPMLCMLLRKRFTSAWLDDITQAGFERALTLHFSALNDFGDRVPLKIVCEMMGRYSNIIFLDDNNLIIDSVKRVGSSKSSVREILPGQAYLPPPAQDKADILKTDEDKIISNIISHRNILLSRAILKVIQGISPLRCMELCVEAYGEDKPVYEIEKDSDRLYQAIVQLKKDLLLPPQPCLVFDENKPVAFSFTQILQYGELLQKTEYACLSDLLDAYYAGKSAAQKRTQVGGELFKLVGSNMDKISRKLALQKKELKESEDSEKYKVYGELINANLYTLESGVSRYHVLNYYTGEMEDIPADILLSPSENANKYYKEYRKKQNAKVFLEEQIRLGNEQLDYLESVLDLLERAETPGEILAIKRELALQGYVKAKPGKRDKAPGEMKPLCFETSGGFSVMVGRNNMANDTLTFKTAGGNDIWLHTKNVHGSHTVLFTNGKSVSEEDLIEAAGICAYYSKARESSNVPVDYTAIKFVKRQPSKIPGRVFYTSYKTVYVTPDKDTIEKLKK
ncbi:MAG: NFACT family protein [Clostridia bacterium]|nr:NFACT family protein [Clostridia bacterium]